MTDSTLHVLAISGSLRRGSYNTALLRAAADIAPESMKIDIYPIGDLPLFDADLEAAGNPEPVIQFRTAVAEADALLLATPEYNFSTTGALKNAIDWASRGGAAHPQADGNPGSRWPLRDPAGPAAFEGDPVAQSGSSGWDSTSTGVNAVRQV